MKNKMIALLVCLIMIFVCSCGPNTGKVQNPSPGNKEIQTVVAMNPSIVTSEGVVSPLRKSISDSMSSDIKSGNITFYSNTNWQWAYATDNGIYTRREIRDLESLKDAAGKTVKGASYAYTVTDDRKSSLSVYDSSMMSVSGYESGELSQTGVLMTFTGGKKEAFVYTAKEECTLSLYDVEGGNISIVKSIASADTDILKSKGAAGVVIGLYINNRIVWQEVLGNSALLGTEVSSVEFPRLSNVEMTSGDSFVITVQAINSANGIEKGYFDIPEKNSVVTKAVKVGRQVELIDEQEDIYFVDEEGNSNFTIITSGKASSKITAVASKLKAGIEDIIGTDVTYRRDNSEIGVDTEHRILVGDTSFAESAAVKNEIVSGRANNAADFIIRRVGKNIVIGGLNEVSLDAAVDYFLANYCTGLNAKLPLAINYVSSKHSSVKQAKIAGNDISKYKIVYSHSASYIDTQAVDYLYKQIILRAGSKLQITDDYTPASKYEILVGTTNRTSGDYAVKSTDGVSGNYSIKVSGNRLLLTSDTSYGIDACIHTFARKLSEVAVFADGYSFNGKYDGGYSLTNGYKLVWSDEFSGNKLSEPWGYQNEYNESEAGGKIITSTECASVKNGALVQRSFADSKKNYYGSVIQSGSSSNPLMWRYGYCEIRIKYPVTTGLKTAFCIISKNQPVYDKFVEFDIVENFGNINAIKRTIHGWSTDEKIHDQYNFDEIINYKHNTKTPEPFGNEYHTIGFEWEPDKLQFTLDGRVTEEFDCSNPKFNYFHSPASMYLLLLPGFKGEIQIDPNFTEDFCYTDYVRIYQKSGNGSSITR